ncbi:MAG: transcriptional regulator, partial [Candidatus Limnocylindria bacterium]
MHLHTDASRVRNWLAGQRPQPPAPELLSELFSEELGYPITPVDIGLPATDEHEVGLRYPESIAATVVAVAQLGRYDMRRRGFLHFGTFLSVAAIAPSRDWLLAVLDATERRPGSRIGEHQVSVIRTAFADFLRADALHGGGYARQALTEYVTGRVLPMLQDADPASEAGSVLLAAASEQTALLGAMAIDDGQQALGQRYLIQALRLAQESGDAAMGAAVLADMSDQARMQGYPREALQLARTGRQGLTQNPSPACASILLALEARAHAALGNSGSAVRAVLESEHVFEGIDTSEEPEWARFIDDTHLSGIWAEVFADLDRPVETARFARRSISAAEDQSRSRREALSQVALARAGMARRDLDGALRAARRAVDLSTTVHSSRCLDAVRDLRSRLSPYRSVAQAREFDDW